jgi:iron complex transport system permease protein
MTSQPSAPTNIPPQAEASAGDSPKVTLRSLAILAGIGLLAAVAIGAACSAIGQYQLGDNLLGDSPWKVWDWPLWSSKVLQIRMNRLAVASVVGAALAAAGMALQGLLRNPLAEPYILGISSGAGVGVLIGPMLAAGAGLSSFATEPVMALVGALLTCLVVYSLAQRRGRLDPYVLLLSGVIVSVFNSAVMMAIMLVMKRNDVLNFISWGMGGISDITSPKVMGLCAACVAAGWLVLLLRGAAFNTLGLGDEVAASSGVPIHWLRVETFAIVGLMTAAAVALAGPIGFVGLIVPHICRLIVGADHRRLVLVSGFAGAILLMIADTVGRTAGPAVGVATIPVGIITAMAGGPFFIFLLRKRFKEGLR